MQSQLIGRIAAYFYATCAVVASMLWFASISPAFGQEAQPTRPGPQTYELRCRGGGLKFSDTPVRPGAGARIANVTVDFIAGTQPSGSRMPTNLKSGQCSWVDRGLRRGEPMQIRLQKPLRDFARMQEALLSAGRYWTFQVYNTNNGYLQATRDMEWVPYR